MAKRKIIRDKNGIVYPVTSKEAVIGLVEDINKLNDSIKALLGVDITYFLGREEAMSLFEQKKDNFEFTDSDDIKWDTSDASKPKAMLQNDVANKITRALLKPEATSTYNRVPYIEANTIEPSFNISTANPSPSTIILRDTNGGCQIKAATVTEVDNNTSPNYVVNNTLLKDYVSSKAFTKPNDTATYTRVPCISANTTDPTFLTASTNPTGSSLVIRNKNGRLYTSAPLATEVENINFDAYGINVRLLREYVAAKSFVKPNSTTNIARIPIVDANTTDQSYLNVTSVVTRGAVVQRNGQGYIQIAAPASTNVDDSNYQFYVPNYAILKDYVAAKTTPKFYQHTLVFGDESIGPYGTIKMTVFNGSADITSIEQARQILEAQSYDAISWIPYIDSEYIYQPIAVKNTEISSEGYLIGTVSYLNVSTIGQNVTSEDDSCSFELFEEYIAPLH